MRIKASRKRTRNEIVEAKAKLAAEAETLQEIKNQNLLLKNKNIEAERVASHTKGILDQMVAKNFGKFEDNGSFTLFDPSQSQGALTPKG